MKFKLVNKQEFPPVQSTILVCKDDGDYIGIVEMIHNDNIYVLLLDRIGRMAINKTDNWIVLNTTDLSKLRYDYKTYIGGSIPKIINDSYKKFESKYIKK